MMDLLTKYRGFGDTRCYVYSVEWQKRGLLLAHILIWLMNKLYSNEVGDIISAEIPDPVTDPHLHDIAMTQMVRGPCGALNPLSHCMADGMCTKRYPRVAETVKGKDAYPVYLRRSKEYNGRTIKVKVQNQEIEIENEFIVPYRSLLSRFFETHANVESCHSAKSIKYLCKYTWLCLVLRRKIRMTKSATSKWADTSVLMKYCGDYCHFKFMKDISQLYI
ncbi:PREDICTED: uncharacterized protein LOC108972649 isoform X1 [Bactrocera latifrons]|uniref:uncharacterized protein LOC108972649 isoform X1 n=1 Tax=Bactrocera latifrons TaxID=174628 RepID=UPI0008DD909A|nr:PREDICTED: uncharacterized protein LOC108972649 isoform X1 [Bactrocera latifrons]